jgi:hypothetical protein
MANLKKQSGGPNTAKGKIRASKNSTKHGLTSMQPIGEDEQSLVDLYVKELVDFYNPQSPLERLQIQRISICRAKLAYLYELEKVKLTLAAKELESQPEKILEKIPGAIGGSKAMALEIIQNGSISLPFSLTPEQLGSISNEIEGVNGQIETQHQFARTLPKLTKFLNAFPIEGLNNANQWMEKLAAIAKRLETLLQFGDSYYGSMEDLFHYYSLGKKYKSHLEYEAMRPALEGLERYQEEVVRPRHGLKPRENESPKKSEEPQFPSEDVLGKQLGLFVTLHGNLNSAEKLVEQYLEIKALMQRSVSLPVAESDLLMRYQTTLERRLSSAIGELLELQKRSITRNGQE